MPRHLSTEAFQMDLRSSPSQQQLDPSRSSSLRSQQDLEHSGDVNEKKPHQLDLYSIPVFLFEVLILLGLAYLAYITHFELQLQLSSSGFYCDDISYRQHYANPMLTKDLSKGNVEIPMGLGLLTISVLLIIFCELVNSMFGALKFRQIRALCTCCKLHSITRRTIRFIGAFMLGFFLVSISCDILATATGRLRPYFAQDCPSAYQPCQAQNYGPGRADLSPCPSTLDNLQTPSTSPTPDTTLTVPLTNFTQPLSSQILPSEGKVDSSRVTRSAPLSVSPTQGDSHVRGRRSASTSPLPLVLVERQWVDLTNMNLSEVCHFPGPGVSEPSPEALWRFNQLSRSWPSYPTALSTYCTLFVACYLCFVGTARPSRMLSSVFIAIILLYNTFFNIQLVKEHYHHWDDVLAGAILAFVAVIFVLMVYLNRFKDTHYYENQKLVKPRLSRASFGGEGALGRYSSDKDDRITMSGNNVQNGDPGQTSNNDLAMRYFHIPRANYSGAPGPVSSLQARVIK